MFRFSTLLTKQLEFSGIPPCGGVGCLGNLVRSNVEYVLSETFLVSLRARAHWPICLATGGRVFVADPSTLGRHVAATCMLCMQTLCLLRGRATACRTLEPQTAVCSPKLENNGFLRE